MKIYQTLLMTVAATGLASGAWAEGYGSPAPSSTSDRLNAAEADMNAQVSTNMNADQMQEIQSNLRDKGYSVSVDGVWGPQTASAVREFQSANNLEVTGNLNNETIAELDVDAAGGVNR